LFHRKIMSVYTENGEVYYLTVAVGEETPPLSISQSDIDRFYVRQSCMPQP